MRTAVVVSRRGGRPAFSLLELTVVLVIIALMSAIAVPRYSRSLERYRVEGAARRIVADLAYARSLARATGAPKTASFDVAGNAYTLIGVADIDHGSPVYTVDLAGDPYNCQITSAILDDATDAGDAVTDVIFDGYGVPDSDGTIVVTVNGQSRTIQLDAVTGKATFN